MLMADEESYYTDGTPQNNFTPGRRSFLSLISAIGPMLSIDSAFADDSGDEESFASIAARASKLSSSVGEMAPSAVTRSTDGKTAYDFSLPVKGESVNFKDIIQQEFDDEGRARVKAILVVNMKEDDPISRTNIPEFISLAAKYVPQYLFLAACCSPFLTSPRPPSPTDMVAPVSLLLYCPQVTRATTSQILHNSLG